MAASVPIQVRNEKPSPGTLSSFALVASAFFCLNRIGTVCAPVVHGRNTNDSQRLALHSAFARQNRDLGMRLTRPQHGLDATNAPWGLLGEGDRNCQKQCGCISSTKWSVAGRALVAVAFRWQELQQGRTPDLSPKPTVKLEELQGWSLWAGWNLALAFMKP